MAEGKNKDSQFDRRTAANKEKGRGKGKEKQREHSRKRASQKNKRNRHQMKSKIERANFRQKVEKKTEHHKRNNNTPRKKPNERSRRRKRNDSLKSKVTRDVRGKKNLDDFLVEDEETIFEQEAKVADQKLEDSFEKKQEDVLEGGQELEQRIQRERPRENSIDQEISGVDEELDFNDIVDSAFDDSEIQSETQEDEPIFIAGDNDAASVDDLGAEEDVDLEEEFADVGLNDDLSELDSTMLGAGEGSEGVFEDPFKDVEYQENDLLPDQEEVLETAEVAQEKIEKIDQQNSQQVTASSPLESAADQQSQVVPTENNQKTPLAEVVKTDVQEVKENTEKKKSYLEVLQEEAKKFEEMQANKEHLGNDPDGVFAEATERNQKSDDDENEDADSKEIEDSVDGQVDHSDIFGEYQPQMNVEGNMMAADGASDMNRSETVGKDDLFNRDQTYAKEAGDVHQSGDLFAGKSEVEKSSENLNTEEVSDLKFLKGIPGEGIDEKVSEVIIDGARNQGREQINDLLDRAAVNKVSQPSSFMGEVKKILAQSGFGFGSLKGFCAIVLIVGFLGLGYWYDVHGKTWRWIQSFGGGSPIVDNSGEPKQIKFLWAVDSGYQFSGQLFGTAPVPAAVETGVQFSEPTKIDNSIVGNAVKAGSQFAVVDNVSSEQMFANYINHVGLMRNLYKTDLQQLLDTEANRIKALDQYLLQLKNAYQKGLDLREEVVARIEVARGEFDTTTAAKKTKEEAFFAKLKAYDGQAADREFKEFLVLRRKQDDYRAEFNAFKKIDEEFGIILVRLDRRIKSIELNYSALVNGVRVADIKGDNLDLIYQPTDL